MPVTPPPTNNNNNLFAIELTQIPFSKEEIKNTQKQILRGIGHAFLILGRTGDSCEIYKMIEKTVRAAISKTKQRL